MNVRLLRKVEKHIEEEPKRFAMGSFIQTKACPTDVVSEHYNRRAMEEDGIVPTHSFARCGTAACIAGWATLLGLGIDAANGVSVDAENEGRRQLELNRDESDKLFYVDSWPKQFKTPYMEAKAPRTRVKIAVARIEHFIATKGRE